MARTIAFSLCRYAFRSAEGGSPLSEAEQLRLFRSLRGRPIAYRKQDASPDDATTYLMRPRRISLKGVDVLTWYIGDDVKARYSLRYNKESDNVEEELSVADEIRITKFVAIPSLAVLGIGDRTGDKFLGAKSAAARMKAVLYQHVEVLAEIDFDGSAEDVQHALTSWKLDHFVFTVRPSNPHPPKLGKRLDAALRGDGISKFYGVATPSNNREMKATERGFIREVAALSEAGYGQYGASGETESGLKASIASPKFDNSKDKNLKRQAENRAFKMHINQSDSEAEEDGQVVQALLDIYGAT